MDCPYCNKALTFHYHFGIGYWYENFDMPLQQARHAKHGDTYKCNNEDCEGLHFYTVEGEKHRILHEGYPC